MAFMDFLIMNGAGNRFGIFDARGAADFALSVDHVRKIAEPGGAIMGPKGADQIIIIRDSDDADVFMEIRNRDGGAVGACGNATRCVAWIILEETQGDNCTIRTDADLLHAGRAGNLRISVDMGEPNVEWNKIPLKEYMSTHIIDVKVGPIDNPVLHSPGAVNMGNPHCVFFVEDFTTAKPDRVGPMIEFHPLFPEQANVGFAKIVDRNHIRLKVWERGVGMTLACGTGACAAVVAAVRRKKTDRTVEVEVDGGVLNIEWRERDNHVIMTGPVEIEGRGTLPA